MGIIQKDIDLLLYGKKNGINFKKTLTIGRQEYFGSLNYLQKHLSTEIRLKNNFSEPIFEFLGSRVLDSMDYSDFEGANIIHDMNKPVEDRLKSKYTFIFDGGTLEHIFNFPQSVINITEMLQIDGHFMAVLPANNWMGHGFYQFSPELFYRFFCKSNGYHMVGIFIRTNKSKWYKLQDPQILKKRTEIKSHTPLTIAVIAKKVEENVLLQTPQQSDYVEQWGQRKKHIYKKRGVFYRLARFIYKIFSGKVIYIRGIGWIRSEIFLKEKK